MNKYTKMSGEALKQAKISLSDMIRSSYATGGKDMDTMAMERKSIEQAENELANIEAELMRRNNGDRKQ